MTDMRRQTEGEGQPPEHTQPAIEQSHAQNRAQLTDGQEYGRDEQERDPAKEAQVVDQTTTTEHLEGIAGSYRRP